MKHPFILILLLALTPPAATAALNDTGETLCDDGTNIMVACTIANTGDAAAMPRQDGRFGRDPAAGASVLTKTGAGAAGFDYTKVCMNGTLNCAGAASNAAAPTATDWACTKDNNTNLTWSLETQAAVWWTVATTTLPDAASAATRCGFTDWRLPSERELLSLVHNGTSNPSIDTSHFPNTVSGNYWSYNSLAFNPFYAWYVAFSIGGTYVADKNISSPVRLVRGALPAAEDFIANPDGTVTDNVTGLMWDQCSQGQSGTGCATGTASSINWTAALAAAVTANSSNYKGYNDWRLPNKNELESLVLINTANNPAIDATAFPATPASSTYWSSTTYTPVPARAWWVIFDLVSYSNGFPKTVLHLVRLVRSGQPLGAFDAQSDSTPDAFSFTDQTGVALSTLITSAPVQITSINTTTSWTASGGTACVSSTSGCACDVATYAASGTITNNQYMCARHTSSASNSTATNTLVTVGGVSDTFTSTTLDDTVPDTFTFVDQSNVPLSTVITSSPVQISGINASTGWNASGGTACVSSGNNCSCDVAGYAASGSITNNQYMCARHTSSASNSTATDTLVTVGGVADTFTSTTLDDTTPNSFAFTAQTGVPLSTVITSNTITVAGINTATAISIVGGTYSINGGAYTAAAGTVNNGDTVTVRQTSSASYSTLTTATLTIGGVAGAFNVTTLAAPPPPPPSPQVDLAVNGNSAVEVTLGNPVVVTHQIASCQNQEMYLILNAPPMGIVWSYLNAAGIWLPLPADLANITPFSAVGPADGGYTLYSGSAPLGDYDLYLGCDFVANGHLDYTGGTSINGVYDYILVHVR